eukprot:CAMPEP_0197942920 /NCGR_PEP_ID=MMETSP1439-20131203/124649_1 /TAXON_ID=66791 /ORGANISM="Gonyaulax spinifera, Strain CCMP409" /LENGTH=433 /DNA_ID=CAMNT_0043566177 /DNA_START=70 /DNA_END=1372 /DNA_ORIENTATION=-
MPAIQTVPEAMKGVLSHGRLPSTVAPSGCSSASEGSEPFREVAIERSLYQLLTHDTSVPIIFGWWPRQAPWRPLDMCERMTRCLPAVRPKLDVVVLPLAEATAALSKHLSLQEWPFLPMYVTSEMQIMAQNVGFRGVIGDAIDHPFGDLANAKAWLHPHISHEKRGRSLRDLAGTVARGPLGYIASSMAELKLAFQKLRTELPDGTKLVLKPSWASGGEGIILNVTQEQLEQFAFPERPGCVAVLEEMIEGRGSLLSPTSYMVGCEPCGGLADQILDEGGAVNLGNRWPSTLPDHVTESCVQVALALQEQWQLKSNWGLDFVLDKEGRPVIVDINMGRPNGNFAVRLWESSFAQQLFLHTASFTTPAGMSCRSLFDALLEQGLLWSDATLEGVVVYQFLPGQVSSFTVASAASWFRVDELIAAFQQILHTIGF